MKNRREVKIERSGTEGPISEKIKIPEKEKRKPSIVLFLMEYLEVTRTKGSLNK